MAFQHSEMNQVRWYVALRTAPQTGSGSTVWQQLLDQLHEEIATLTAQYNFIRMVKLDEI